MANWSVHAPPSVKAPTKAVAERNARGLVTVSKIVAPTTPAFLNGLTKLWSDDCSSPDPTPRWGEISMQRKDGVQVSSTSMSDIASGRFQQFPNGGPDNKPYYRFTAPQGDNQWTPGSSGRSEIAMHNLWFHEGERRVTLVAVRLPATEYPFTWNTLIQWKQNESKNWTGGSPALAFEQWGNEWKIRTFGRDDWVPWHIPCPASHRGIWTRFAFDITYSSGPTVGKLKVYADTNGDGVYEYQSPTVTLQTLLPPPPQSGTGPGIESHIRAGLYIGQGGYSIEEADFSVWG